MEVQDKIRQFIMKNLISFEDEMDFSDHDNIFQLGFVNSLFAVKMLNYVEREFEIKIDNEDMDIKNFSSINNIMELINKKKYERQII